MNTEAYIDISKRIATKVPEIKHKDLYNRQYEEPKVNHPYNTPAVFIEFMPTNWDNETRGIQEGQGTLRIHIVMNTLKDSANIDALTPALAAARLNHYDVVKKVHAALHGYKAAGTASPMQRISSTPDHNHDMIIVEILEYQYTDCDNSADKYANYIDTNIQDFKTPGNIIDSL